MLPNERFDELAASVGLFDLVRWVAELAVLAVNSRRRETVETTTRGRKTGNREIIWGEGIPVILNISGVGS